MFILPISLILIFFIYLYKFNKNIMDPVNFICSVWFIFIFFSILFLNNYKFYYYGILWIILVLFLMILMSNHFEKKNDKNMIIIKKNITIPWKILYLFLLLSFAYVFVSLYDLGYSLSIFFDINKLFEVSHNISVDRYSGQQTVSILSLLLSTFVYLSPLCSGYSILFGNKKQKVLCLLCFIPPTLSMILTSAKLAIIASIILFFIGFYVSYINEKGTTFKLNKNIIIKLISIAVVLYGFVFISFTFRIGRFSFEDFQAIYNKIFIYAFGHIQGFDLWFYKDGLHISKLGLGGNTFLAISSKLGFSIKKQGIYDMITGSCTNVYTPFRCIIEDFGVLPSILILCFLSFIIKYSYRKIVISKNNNFYIFLLTVILFSFLYFIVSPWVYTVFYIVFFLYYCFLYITTDNKITTYLKKWGIYD